MTILLRTSRNLPDPAAYDRWLALGKCEPKLDPARYDSDTSELLEAAYGPALESWREMAPLLTEGVHAEFAHTPACAPNASDFGEALAWSRVLADLGEASPRFLVVCDDPWTYRHVATLAHVNAGQPPSLWPQHVGLVSRGIAARSWTVMRLLVALFRLRASRARFPRHASTILVYGHPSSSRDGRDGYFGDLMSAIPDLARMLHVDCPADRVAQLADGRRTFSLHAWGSIPLALSLLFTRWRPSKSLRGGKLGWLVRRASVREGATAQAAMIRWQAGCQARWLADAHPACVAWPWENHAWERPFVRSCRSLGIRTIGYQHSTVGRFEANYSPRCNVDGLASIPDIVVTTGPAGYDALKGMGYSDDRLEIGGAFRLRAGKAPTFAPDAPVFVALPFDHRVSEEIVEAVRGLAGHGRTILVKDHPMTPFEIVEGGGLARTQTPLGEMDHVSAVIYAGTTVGLEGRLAGLPTFRFLSSRCVPNDIMPASLNVPTITARTLARLLAESPTPSPADPEAVFRFPDIALWRNLLAPATASLDGG